MKTIQDIFDIHGRFVSVANLTDYERHLLYRAVKSGDAIKIKAGVYAHPEFLADTIIDIDKIIPDGILCLWSAWAVYGLTTQIPNAYYVAIENKRKIRLPAYPKFQLVYQSPKQLYLGAIEIELNGYKVKIYDIERCVCDAIKYRNKIGVDVMAEIVQNYLKSDRRNLAKMMQYAKKLRIVQTLNKYLELWQ